MYCKDIEPCPFCGSDDIEICQTNPEAIWFHCAGCNAQTDSADNIEKALEYWNMRPEAENG